MGLKAMKQPPGARDVQGTDDGLPEAGAKKTPRASKTTPAVASTPSLVICRNKHWRYISCFHGPWLQMPIELLETLANINYNTPIPRPIDPAVFFDLVKVRRLVDEATNLAVRAASGIASPTLTNVNGGFPSGSSMNTFGMTGPGHGAKLSRERKFRMREQAVQKLARAYRLDEIACSVATMQGASPLEEVGGLVLQRSPQNLDAKYVHFFHEKIPSRHLADCTSLDPLLDIIEALPKLREVRRTSAVVRVFKEDFDGALGNLTEALAIPPEIKHDRTGQKDAPVDGPQLTRRRPYDVILAENDQPCSLDGQLLFQRASVYLTMASQNVLKSLPAMTQASKAEPSAINGSDKGATENTTGGDSAYLDKELLQQRAESQKLVKLFAKRAIKDFLAFIARFQYSPNLPIKIAKEFNDRVNLVCNGLRSSRSIEPQDPEEPHTVYPLSDLFSSVPPADLPPYPSDQVVQLGRQPQSVPSATSCEWVTYHPLLNDALHSLLLSHCLAQTSAKEIQRNAYMVARLVRLSDGYPVFQAGRSPARADWVEVVRRTENWLHLGASWKILCEPAPLPIYDCETEMQEVASGPNKAALAAAALVSRGNVDPAAEGEQRKGGIREHASMDALDSEGVTDEASLHADISSREKYTKQEQSLLFGNGTSPRLPPSSGVPNGSRGSARAGSAAGLEAAMRRWSAEDSKEFPILTERAASIARWVRDAPIVTGLVRRKKRTKKTTNAVRGGSTVVNGLEVGEAVGA